MPNIKAKKQYGQNFLKDQNIIKKIVSSSDIDKNTTVIEIGPGTGALTEELLKYAKKVICYEIDHDMVEILNEKFKNIEEEKLQIIEKDFLKADLKEIIAKDEKYTITANLPYYITTPILLKILEELNFIDNITIMIQKEVAQRLAGKPSTKDYNALSVLVQYKHTAKILFDVSKNSFDPVPDVTSSVIQITKKTITDEPLFEPFFYEFNRNIFKMRRKTLINNIKETYKNIYTKEEIEKILTKNNLDLKIRSENLTVQQIINLSNDFYLQKNHA